MKLVAALGLVLVLSTACATITTGTTQSILVDTTPDGAICRFSREGEAIGVVNPTPGMLMVGKSVQPIGVTCTKDGYLPTIGRVQSEYQPMTSGNILLGGVVGIIIDAASGAQSRYESSVHIVLSKADNTALEKAISDINSSSSGGR